MDRQRKPLLLKTPVNAIATHTMLQGALVEQPTQEHLRHVLSTSVLAPASDPVDEVRSGLDFTHSTIAKCLSFCEHMTMPLLAPIITNLELSSPLTLPMSFYLSLVFGNAGPIRLCRVLDRTLSLRAFVGVAKQHVSCGEPVIN